MEADFGLFRHAFARLTGNLMRFLFLLALMMAVPLSWPSARADTTISAHPEARPFDAAADAAALVDAALARAAPPVVEIPAYDLADPTPAEYLTGDTLPPELTPIRYLTTWDLDLLWALVVVFGLFFYLAAVVRLHRRGDRCRGTAPRSS